MEILQVLVVCRNGEDNFIRKFFFTGDNQKCSITMKSDVKMVADLSSEVMFSPRGEGSTLDIKISGTAYTECQEEETNEEKSE